MSTKREPGQFDCYKKLGIDEPYFVIRAKDPVAPQVVRHWMRLREATPGNAGNPKLQEALECAEAMRAWRAVEMSGRGCGCDPGADHKCEHHGSEGIAQLQHMLDQARADVRDDVYAKLQEIMIFAAVIEKVIGEVGIADVKDVINRKAIEIFTREPGHAVVV